MVFINCDDPLAEVDNKNELFNITGRVNVRNKFDLENIRILVDDGLFVGHPKADGSFVIVNIPSNSYVVEISAPKLQFEPIRVDISNKGKVRARRLNLLQPNDIKVVQYPLNFEPRGFPNYFQKRDEFRIMDILMSPMVLMMVVPLLLVLVLPKLMNQDPELQRELQQSPILQAPGQNMPSLSEMAQNIFGGGAAGASPNRPNAQRRPNTQRSPQGAGQRRA